MEFATATRLAVIPIIIAAPWRFIKYIHSDHDLLTKRSRLNYLIAGGLAVVAIASSVPRPTSLWLHSICVVSLHQALLVYYLNIEQVTSGQIVQFHKTRLYTIITLMSIVVIIL